nr:MAG TPA: hypothetical protein [Caudoviricetes sp.]
MQKRIKKAMFGFIARGVERSNFLLTMIRKLVICSINANRQTAKKCLK